jgi:hypothetical protein
MVMRAAERVMDSSLRSDVASLCSKRHDRWMMDWRYGVWDHKGQGDCGLLVFALLDHGPGDDVMHGDKTMCVRSEVLVDREADFFGKIESEMLSTSMIAGFPRALSRRIRSLHRDGVLSSSSKLWWRVWTTTLAEINYCTVSLMFSCHPEL